MATDMDPVPWSHRKWVAGGDDADAVLEGIGEIKAEIVDVKARVAALSVKVDELASVFTDVAVFYRTSNVQDVRLGSDGSENVINPVCRDFVYDGAYQEPVHELAKILRQIGLRPGKPRWR